MAHGKRRDLKLEAGWRRALARQRRSGLTAREFCRRERVAESALHFWKRELARRDAEGPARRPGGRSSADRKRGPRRLPSLIPVSIGPAITHAAPVEVMLPHGVSVRVAAGCEEATLRMVLSALERGS
jgi:hypothetical protein